MYDKKCTSVTSHALYPPPPVTNCHTFSDPLEHDVLYGRPLDNMIGLSLIYVTVQHTWNKVGIVFQWENKIMRPFPSVMPRVLKFREKFIQHMMGLTQYRAINYQSVV